MICFRAGVIAGAALLLASGPALAAQMPTVVNAKVEQRSAAAGLQRTVDGIREGAAQPAWIAYAVPAVDGPRAGCCGGQGTSGAVVDCGPCRLEGGGAFAGSAQPVPLEGPRDVLILHRVENRRVDRIRTFSSDCALDAGGLPFVWLTDVRPADSVALLAGEVGSGQVGQERLARGAMVALAQHRDTTADRALERFLAPGQPIALRKDAAFWLGQARGAAGLAALRQAVADPDADLRRQVTFALSVSRAPGAVDLLFRMAREDQAPAVRGQALFWIAQKAGAKAAGAITEAIEKDPDTEVKRRAVFALSQMPGDEGVPRLIQVARTNANPVVRKQAIFWLGQSKDPRALDFFREILAR